MQLITENYINELCLIAGETGSVCGLQPLLALLALLWMVLLSPNIHLTAFSLIQTQTDHRLVDGVKLTAPPDILEDFLQWNIEQHSILAD